MHRCNTRVPSPDPTRPAHPPALYSLVFCPVVSDNKNVALLDTYLRQRAQDNLAKHRPGQSDTVTPLPPSQGIEQRFTDVSVEAQPLPREQMMQPTAATTGRGIMGGKGVPKRGRSGEQEMGVL